MGTAASGKKIALMFVAAAIVLGLVLFVPAGTLDYWQAWVYMAIILVPMLFVVLYMTARDPALLERRLNLKEKEATQRSVLRFAYTLLIIGILLPGLDRRFGWSSVPLELAIAANIVVFIGYVITFLAMKENTYAARTVAVEKGQKVISTGPYSIVRHPMYLGQILLFIATPIALGSYWAIPPFLLIPVVMVFRIQNEEDLLRRKLLGYKEYCRKTRYRLIPFVW
jgi:protein-S-isoprenylcysteine O-methyltransferase Ste14